jgi:integrase
VVPFYDIKNSLRLPEMTMHDLRHLHASLLLEAGLPVPQVSKRLGHATPAITMSIYAHVVRQDDDAATIAISKAMRG